MFNVVYGGFKLHRFSQGDVILHNTVIKAGDGLGIYTSEPFNHARIEHNLFVGGKPLSGMSFGGYSPGRGRAMDVQQFGDQCILDHNTYAVVGQPFEGKIRSSTFTTLPGKNYESHGRIIEFSSPFPEDPARLYDPPDLTSLNQAGAYAGESRVPVMDRGSQTRLTGIGSAMGAREAHEPGEGESAWIICWSEW